MEKLSERQYNGGAWTAGRFNSFVTSALRAASRRWPPKYECLNEAKTEKKINTKTGRLAQHFKCAACGNEFTSKDVQVDHTVPIGQERSWDEFVNLLFCEKENLQVLCLTCHKSKTKEENENRKRSKAA